MDTRRPARLARLRLLSGPTLAVVGGLQPGPNAEAKMAARKAQIEHAGAVAGPVLRRRRQGQRRVQICADSVLRDGFTVGTRR